MHFNKCFKISGYSDTVVLLGAFFVLTLPRLGEIFIWWKMTAIRYTFPYLFPIGPNFLCLVIIRPLLCTHL